jgi:hypothetical protein
MPDDLIKRLLLDLRSVPANITYITPGQPIPKGVTIERGARGGTFYRTRSQTINRPHAHNSEVTQKEKSSDTDIIDSVAARSVTHAIKVEPKISATMKNIAKEVGGELAGFEFRLKSFESTRRKIMMDCQEEPDLTPEKAAAKLADLVRYTLLFDPDMYTEKSDNTLKYLEEQGFNIKKVKNFWKIGDGSYKGINCQIEKDGQLFELQFHTPQSLKIKEEKSHPLYDLHKKTQDILEKQKIMDQIKSVWNEVKLPAPYAS